METIHNLMLNVMVIILIPTAMSDTMTRQPEKIDPVTSSANTTQDTINTTSTEKQNQSTATVQVVNMTAFYNNTTTAMGGTNHTTMEPLRSTKQSQMRSTVPLSRFQFEAYKSKAKCSRDSPVLPIFINETLVIIHYSDFVWFVKCVKSVRVPKICTPPYNPISRNFEDYTIMSIILNIYITIPLCILGIIGNILSFITLSREKQNTSIMILKSLAVIDSIYLLLVVVFEPFNIAYHDTDWLDRSTRDKLSHKFEIASTYAIPVINMAQMCSAWLVVLLTIDRYIAICHPFKAMTYCTIKRARIGICIIIALSVVYNIPMFWGVDYLWIFHECLKLWIVVNGDIRGSIGQNILYRIIYGFAGDLIFRNLLPVLLVVSLNAKLIHSLRLSHQNRDKITSNHADHNQEHRDKNITTTLVSISFVYLICILPMLVSSVLDIYFKSVLTAKYSNTRLYYTAEEGSYQNNLKFQLFVSLLVKLNSAINFLVYCLVRKGFRSKLFGVFKMAVQREGSQITISSRYKTSDKSKQSY